MTADEFIAWSMDQPKPVRYELAGGEVIQMASQRVSHALLKGRVFRRLEEAVEKAGLGCQVFPDGMAVRVDDDTVYEPDAAVRCADPLAGDAVVYDDPVIIVEILSPSTQGVDTGVKFTDYLRVPSVFHYLIVYGGRRHVVHHARQTDGSITTRLVEIGPLHLVPPWHNPGRRLSVSLIQGGGSRHNHDTFRCCNIDTQMHTSS